MTKEQFIKMMKELVSIKKDEEALQKAFQKFEPEFDHFCFNRYEELVVRSIELAMNDKYDWISYWIYDLECGTKAKRDSVQDKYGNDMEVRTLANLYEIIKFSE